MEKKQNKKTPPAVCHISPPNLIPAMISLNNNLLPKWKAKRNPGTSITRQRLFDTREACNAPLSYTFGCSKSNTCWLKMFHLVLKPTTLRKKNTVDIFLSVDQPRKKTPRQYLKFAFGGRSVETQLRRLCAAEDKESSAYIKCPHSKDE